MPITGQDGRWLWAYDYDGWNSHTVTIQVRNRDTLAEIALDEVEVLDQDTHSSFCFISRIVSDKGIEGVSGGG